MFSIRRYVVLTKDYLLTFSQKGNYSTPTESIRMEGCSTVKSSDDEINKEFSFVSTIFKDTSADLCMLFQKLDISGTTFYFYAECYEEKEGWIGDRTDIAGQYLFASMM